MSSQLLGIERDVLESGCAGAHADEVGHPSGAAELASARAYSAYAPCLLPGPDLLHLYPHSEAVGQDLDELAEVDTLIGYVVEDGLVAVALILHVAYLHVEAQSESYLAALYHGLMLPALGLVELVDVHLAGLPVYLLQLCARLGVGLLELERHEAASHGDCANVVSRISFHSHNVALGELQFIGVEEVTLARWLELHLHYVACCRVVGQVSEPVVRIEFVGALAAS